MKFKFKSKTATAVGLVLALAAGSAAAAGLWGNWPVAGVAPYTYTLPLTGNENIPMDTNLPQGVNPASQVATYAQLLQGTINTSANTSSFTAGVSAVDGGENLTLLLTGAITSGQNLTLPTAAQLQAAMPIGAVAGYSYVLKFVNVGGSSSGVWTIVAGSNDTITGNATVAVAGSRKYLVTWPAAAPTTITLQDLGN